MKEHFKGLTKESLDNLSNDKVHIIQFNDIYYLDLVTIEPLLDLLTSSAINEILVGIETEDCMPDWLSETIQSYQHKLFKENGIEEEFFQVNLENKQIKNNGKFFDFIKAIAEINDFVFIVVNPKKELPNYICNTKVVIDTTNGESYIIFDYDAYGVFILC
jgi:hypothetical protein